MPTESARTGALLDQLLRRDFVASAAWFGVGLLASMPCLRGQPTGPAAPTIHPFSIEGRTLVVPAGVYRTGAAGEVRVSTTARLEITPADIATVRDEELLLSEKPPAGFFTGTQLQGTKAKNIGALRSLIEESLELKDGSGRKLKKGDDYLVAAPFALLGLGPRASVTATTKVFATYAHYLQRIDVVAADARGVAFIIPGVPSVMSPALPIVPRGATAIASVYRPFLAKTLEPAHVFPITARAGDAPTATTRGRIPKTLRKLEAGEAVTVVCWGDSITVGADVEPGEAWANRVLAELQKKFPRARINHRNHSIGGTKTAQWLHNGDFAGLPKQNPEKCRFENILAEKPDLVVMEFLNDIVFKEDVLASTYQRIHEAFAARGIEWIIVTPSQKIPENFNLAEMKDDQPRLLDTFLRHFADRHGYALADAAARWKHLHREGVPYFALFNNAFNHPNAFGHQLFIEEIMQCFQP
jgi:hypothetical protein